MSDKASILIVEDSPTMALTYREYLRPVGLECDIAETGQIALTKIRILDPAVILLDLKLPDMDGLDILKKLTADGHRARVIVITAHGSVATAVDAMRDGASDFLLKPFAAERLLTTVRNALELHRLEGLVAQYSVRKAQKFGEFIGDSPAMRALYRMIEDSASSRASVFLIGPSGTGKELCANAIHRLSPRKNRHLVALNCAAIPANLIESEIFGHVKGAFTGATADREGAAVRANGGTLFLDEICEMPLDLQAKLLRFIQTGQVVPVGSSTPRNVDVRFVCATNRIPWEEVAAGRFREDLYYRLHVIPIHVPLLKDRGQDVLMIAREMLKQFAAEEKKAFETLAPDAEARLMAHSWPGNVRELGNVIQSTVVLNDGPALTGAMLLPLMGPSRRLGDEGPASAPGLTPAADTDTGIDTGTNSGEIEPLATSERKLIERAIRLSDGKIHQAARKLGVNASTLYRKMKNWA